MLHIRKNSDLALINQGRILSKLNSLESDWKIQKYEFKVYSQWGDDGIIQFLVNKLKIVNRTFIEFGVEDFTESNTRFLLIKDNWSGFVIDSSDKHIDKINRNISNWKYDFKAHNEFITARNINSILELSNFDKDLGLLSIDIDGNDFYILEAITEYTPRILICEYNSLFGDKRKITVPYQENFSRTKFHFSNLFYGASLPALNYISEIKGYKLVGTNSHGVNAYFVREDLIPKNFPDFTLEEVFTQRKFRESRDKNGKLDLLDIEVSIKSLKGNHVFNVENKELEVF